MPPPLVAVGVKVTVGAVSDGGARSGAAMLTAASALLTYTP
jgi:hypothetical protein